MSAAPVAPGPGVDPPEPPDVELRDVVVRYDERDTDALRGVSLRVAGGTVCGLLGRNGAGKTTLLSLVASLRRPTSGEVRVGGVDPFEHAPTMARVALVGEARGGSVHTVADALDLARSLRPSWDAAYARRLADRFELPRRKKVGKLSRGQQAALGVVCGLAARAPVTLFDEPHLGMDVQSRYAFYDELLAEVAERPRTVVLSTHHVDEVASLLGEVAIIAEGRVLLHAEADELRGRGTEVTGPAEAVDRFTAGTEVLSERTLGPTKAAVVYGEITDGRRREAAGAGLELGPLPLQDLVVHLTGRPADTSDEPTDDTGTGTDTEERA
jgi:ABC-2 type transport system ATP-binding protein